jgi:hypothetical protein
VAALQLDVDLPPAVQHLILHPDQPVVAADDPERQQRDDDEENDDGHRWK